MSGFVVDRAQESSDPTSPKGAWIAEGSDPARDAFRRWGYLQADLDPLGRLEPVSHPELDQYPESPWRKTYCGSLAAEFLHLPFPDRVRWLARRLEVEAASANHARILEPILRGEVFEQVLQARYPGTKRFSIEGMAALLPMLQEMILAASERGAAEALLGMSHRGRLGVIVNVIGRRAAEVFAGFEDVDPRSSLGGGDVKYHLGANSSRALSNGRRILVSLASNPSHLEAVDPVLLGRARARQVRRGSTESVLPVLLHGDGAFAGQGIASETLNLAGLQGYSVGGTVHVILNNMIGFTTPPGSLYSTRYASDAAHRMPIPILHVNGEDPEAAVRAARIAVDYRYEFESDILIDLVGYRRHGHSEADDPTVTDPLLYRRIAEIPPLFRSYAAKKGLATKNLEDAVRGELERELEEARGFRRQPALREMPPWWSRYVGGPFKLEYEVETAVPLDLLAEVGDRLTRAPEGFQPHPKIARMLQGRRKMARGEQLVDWGGSEALALGTLLAQGVRVRLSGQDARRGTFNHRHAVLFDFQNEAEHIPLAGFKGSFECVDSPLSEAAPLGFEYGYSRDLPEALVLWEAQFGDFANGAQVILDQFIAAGEDKWGLLSGLVLLLPHGYEGQGPEHSSARLERFLQLAAGDNMEIVLPSTAAQYFHLLRRQALRTWRKPLVVLTPKSLLRRPEAASPSHELVEGKFLPVLGDSAVAADRILLSSGKIVHDLRAERARRHDAGTAIVSIEKLHPFPEAELQAELARHTGAREIVWVQEEPANMGALSFVLPRIERLAGDRHVRTVKRSPSASPATGSARAHDLEQSALIHVALARLSMREEVQALAGKPAITKPPEGRLPFSNS